MISPFSDKPMLSTCLIDSLLGVFLDGQSGFFVFSCVFCFWFWDLWDELMGKSRYRPHAGDK